MFEIQALSASRLSAAIALTCSIFPNPPLLEHPALSLPLSLGDKRLIRLFGLGDLAYWVAIRDNMVVGITGLYSWDSEPGIAWLGWTCVNPANRRHQIGLSLLHTVIKHARDLEYQQLNLWSTNHPDYAIANRMFDLLGFKTVKAEPSDSAFYRIERTLFL